MHPKRTLTRWRALWSATLLYSSLLAHAQLNEHCVVSVLNRTAQVDAEGGWAIPNVPAGFGLARARATCVEGGVTRVGQSDYFNIPPNGAVSNVEIVFDAPQPVPGTLRLDATVTTLTNIGETAQLTATATYPGGSRQDVTRAAGGTSYTTSNGQIVTVGADGIITARGNGMAIVSAMNEGALALLRVSVSVSTIMDSDGDGMPDDYELANSLNPNDPSDAVLDFDGDGLTNKQEFTSGTDIRVPDTDGDGLRDGVELQTGSDPLDPTSFNLAAAVTALRLTPQTVYLVVNTVEGEASKVVRVLGDVIDGSTIDLTARSRGTSYQSSNPAIAGFGTRDGEIFAGLSGEAVLTVRNGALIVTAPVSVRTFSPTALSWLSIPGFANNIHVAGNLAYVAAGSTGLQIVDVTNRFAPRIIGALDTAGNANDVRVVGTTAFVADGVSGLVAIDVSIPTQPRLVAAFDTPGTALDLMIVGNLAYIADGGSGIRIVDITTPATPQLRGALALGLTVHGLDVSGNVLIAAVGTSGMRTIDISTPGSPTLLGSLAMTDARDLRIRGSNAYVADYTGSLALVDISAPSTPRLVTRTSQSNGGILNDVAIFENFAFGADIFFVNGVPITEVSNPMMLQERGRVDFPFRDDNGMGVAADANYVYLVAAQGATEKPGTTGVTALYIGQYREIQDSNGIPPTVSISSPTPTTTLAEGATFSVTVQAFDDVKVQRVTLYVDGTEAGTTTTSPYVFTTRAPIDRTTTDLYATALDVGGNLGRSDTLTLGVTPDTAPPSVLLGPPYSGNTFANGTQLSVTVNAADPSGIGRVEFLVNGTLTGADTTEPYVFAYTLPQSAASLSLSARAYDRAGNIATTPNTVITVYTDFPPTGTFTITPSAPLALFNGGDFKVSGTASDDRGTVQKAELLVNNVVVEYLTGRNTLAFSTAMVPYGVGTVDVTVRLTDSGGLQTTLPVKTMQVRQTSALGVTSLAGYASDVAVQGNYAYAAVGESGLEVVDVSDPGTPFAITTLDTPGSALRVIVRGAYAFVADGESGVHVVSVSAPAVPRIVATIPTSAKANDLVQRNDRLYVGTDLGFEIIDIRDPRAPRSVATQTLARAVQSVAVIGDYALLLVDDYKTSCSFCGTDMIVILDLTSEAAPTIRSEVAIPTTNRGTLSVDGSRVFVASSSEIYVYDFANGVLTSRGSSDSNDFRSDYAETSVFGGLALSATAAANHVAILSADDPAVLRHIGAIDFYKNGTRYYGSALARSPEIVYTTGAPQFGTAAMSSLFTGRYLTRTDAGQNRPQVSISAPANGLTVIAGQAVPIKVAASDDIAVRSLQLLVNGVLLSTSTVAPFEYLYDVPVGANGEFRIAAVATDYAGLTGEAEVRLNVVPDIAAPVVRTTRPSSGRSLPSSTIQLSAEASDDASVVAVEFLVNGQLIATDTVAPFDAEYTLAGTGTVDVDVRATDASGNVGYGARVTTAIYTPQVLSSVILAGEARGLGVSGDLAFVATKNALQVFNIGNPVAPQLLSTIASVDELHDVSVLGNYVYVMAGAGTSGQLRAFDASNPSGLQLLASSSPGGTAVVASGLTAYGSSSSGVLLRDISDPSALPLGTLWSSIKGRVDVQDERVVSGVNNQILGYNTVLLTASLPVFQSWEADEILTTRLRDGFAAVGMRRGLAVTSLTDRFTWLRTSTTFPNIVAIDHLADTLAAGTFSNATVGLFDMTSPRDPRFRTNVVLAGGTSSISDVVLTPTHVIATGAASHPTYRLFIARYRTYDDAKNVAPVATFVLGPGGPARAGRLLNLRAIATDDIGVANVGFIVDGVLVFSDTIPPYEFNYLVPPGATALAIQVRALDYGANAATSATVNVPVNP